MYNNPPIPLNQNLTIVVNSCDAYVDVLSLFRIFFRRFWPDCPFEIVVHTETREYGLNSSRLSSFPPTKHDIWGARVQRTLNNISTDYVLMLYDDFFLNSNISNLSILHALDLIDSNNLAALYLTKPYIDVSTYLPITLENYLRISPSSDFLLSSRPAIWRKNILFNSISQHDSPWSWELFGSYRFRDFDYGIFALSPSSSNIYSYDNSMGGAVYRGLWVKSVVDYVTSNISTNLDFNSRGIVDSRLPPSRSIIWMIKFLIKGFQTSGFKAFYAFRLSFLKSAHRKFFNG